MKVHLHAGNKNDRSRNIREHRNTGCQIIHRRIDEAVRHHHPQITVPEYKIVNIKSQCIEQIDHDQLPVFLEIRKHFPVAVAVRLKITLDRCRLKYRRQKESAAECQQHAVSNVAFASPHKEK